VAQPLSLLRHFLLKSGEAINVIASPFSERAKQSLIECVGILLRLLHSLRSFAMTGASLGSQQYAAVPPKRGARPNKI